MRSVSYILTYRGPGSVATVLLSDPDSRRSTMIIHSSTCDFWAFRSWSLLSVFCSYHGKCSSWKISFKILRTMWKYACWCCWSSYSSRIFRCNFQNWFCLDPKPNASFKSPLSQGYPVVEKVFSLWIVLHIPPCPRAIATSAEWPQHFPSFLTKLSYQEKFRARKSLTLCKSRLLFLPPPS